MATTISISCPECDKRIKVSSELEGKKIRCKECGETFRVKVPADKVGPATTKGKDKPGSKPGPAKEKVKPKEPPPPKSVRDDDEESNPYDVTHLDTAPRCPHCANEMESPEAIICLYCGYNTITRHSVGMRKTIETTGGEQFLWLLPGIGAALGIFAIIGAFCYYWFQMPSDAIDKWDTIMAKPEVDGSRIKACKQEDMPFSGYLFHPMIAIWLLVFALWGIYKSARFAIKRLAYDNVAPEKLKR
jgi:predicted Zn finger-like uncharacterized protein